MSNFAKNTTDPRTGKFEPAIWIDDFYGSHLYGVQFKDGAIFDPRIFTLNTNDKPCDIDWKNFKVGKAIDE